MKIGTRSPAKTKNKKSVASPSELRPKQSEVRDPLQSSKYPELVFGLIGPTGTNLGLVVDVLRTVLSRLDYQCCEIVLSSVIEEFLGKSHRGIPENERIDRLMDDGTSIRKKSERGDAVALLSIPKIRSYREKRTGDPRVAAAKTAYILRSLKHPHEVRSLRTIYGRGFYAISVYSPRSNRVDGLTSRIIKSLNNKNPFARSEAERLIAKDELELGTKFGQDVKDAFPLADLFVDGRTKEVLEQSISRFIELIFQHPYHSPSRDELGMHLARSAALRSSDLSRQVGAVIATKDGEVLALGCNEVPKFGGGLYWPGDQSDARDFQIGQDASAAQKKAILAEILQRFLDEKVLARPLRKQTAGDIADRMLYGDMRRILDQAQVLDLLEFGRAVHAEMAALIDAARIGVSVKGATMYTTTFPCHICARHIVAAGIRRVVYIEPYPKSMAQELYPDSIVVDTQDVPADKVSFESFVGIAPRQYLDLFAMLDRRKDERGRVLDWNAEEKSLRVSRVLNTYINLEDLVIGTLIPFISEKAS